MSWMLSPRVRWRLPMLDPTHPRKIRRQSLTWRTRLRCRTCWPRTRSLMLCGLFSPENQALIQSFPQASRRRHNTSCSSRIYDTHPLMSSIALMPYSPWRFPASFLTVEPTLLNLDCAPLITEITSSTRCAGTTGVLHATRPSASSPSTR